MAVTAAATVNGPNGRLYVDGYSACSARLPSRQPRERPGARSGSQAPGHPESPPPRPAR
jgi:hypothetical protein